MTSRRPVPEPPSARRRRRRGMGMTRKTGYYLEAETGQKVPYTYWQASQEVPPAALPPGVVRKRITGSGPTQKAAEERLRENWEAFTKGEPTPRTKLRGVPDLTLTELYERWDKSNKAGAVSEMMTYKYRGYFQNHILPHIGKRKARHLTEDDFLLLFGTTLVSKTRPDGSQLLGSNARRNVYNALSGCLNYGVRNGYLLRNTLRAIKPPAKTTPTIDIETISADARRLLAALSQEGTGDYCRWLFQFLGLRRAERLGLAWSSIHGLDTDSPTMRIEQQLARYSGVLEDQPTGWYIKKATKTRKTRTIVIPEPFLSALRQHKAAQDKQRKSKKWNPEPEFADLVFLQPDGSIYTLNRDNREWGKLLERLGFPYWRGHINRHITATWLAEQTPPVPMGMVREILGHESEAMGYYYAKSTQTQQAEPMRNYGQGIANAGTSGSTTSRRTRARSRE